MANQKQEQPNISDSVFDFIFATQKKGVNKPIPQTKNLDEYSSALLELGTMPAVYPLETAFSTINDFVKGNLKIKTADGVSFSLTELGDSSKAVQKSISKNRAKATWASIGGGLHSSIDGALVTLLAKRNGASSRIATKIGKLQNRLIKHQRSIIEGDPHLFGYQTEKELLEENNNFLMEGLELDVNSVMDMYSNIPKDALLDNIYKLQKQGNKQERLRSTAAVLKQNGMDIKEGFKVAELIWGGIDKDEELGLYKDEKRTEIDIANEALTFALSKDILVNLKKEGKYGEINDIQRRVREVIDYERGNTLGMRAERTLLLGRWLSSMKDWRGIISSGAWERFEMGGLGFTKIVEEQKVYKKNTNGKDEIVGSYYKESNTVLGKLLGKYYYWHPQNFLKGILNGNLFLKKACDRNGNLNTKSFYYFMYNMAPGKSMQFLMKPVQGLFNKITGAFSPMKAAIMNFAKSALKKILGATGIGGLIMNFLLGKLADKLSYIITQIAIVMVAGILGFVFVLLQDNNWLSSDSEVQSVTDYKQEQTYTESGMFTDTDFYEIPNE